MPFQRHRMAVIKVTAERKGVELIDELGARFDLADAGDAVHAGAVDAMKMHGMRHRSAIAEHYPQSLALGGAQGWTGHPAVIGPGREEDTRRDLDLLVLGGNPELADRAAIGVA